MRPSEEGALCVRLTGNHRVIKGVGGSNTLSEEVEVELKRKDGTKVRLLQM